MQTAGSESDSPATAIFATLPVIASDHPRDLGWERVLLMCYTKTKEVETWRTG